MDLNETKNNETIEKTNYAGGVTYDTPSIKRLTKLSINNLLEGKYYADDEESLSDIKEVFREVVKNNPKFPLQLATYCRNEMYLRDISQVLLVLSANDDNSKEYVEEYAPKIIQRADELNTAVATQLKLYGKPIPNELVNGVQDAFHNFDKYQFSKYQQKNREVSLVDTINLIHPKPQNEEEEEVFERIVKGNLDDYPEVSPLKAPKDKRAIYEATDKEDWLEVIEKMGLFAKVRNIKNMKQVGLDGEQILTEDDLDYVKDSKMYPFRFYQAYKVMKDEYIEDNYLEDWLSKAIEISASNLPDKISNTYVGVDLSGSMDTALSRKSFMTYKEISSLFGALLMKKGAKVIAFGDDAELVNAHHSTPTLELQQKIINTSVGTSTNGWKVIKHLYEEQIECDRIIIFTDMQIWDSVSFLNDQTLKEWFVKYKSNINSEAKLYMVDLSSYGQVSMPDNYPDVYSIQGWNSKIIDYIVNVENLDDMLEEIKSK